MARSNKKHTEKKADSIQAKIDSLRKTTVFEEADIQKNAVAEENTPPETVDTENLHEAEAFLKQYEQRLRQKPYRRAKPRKSLYDPKDEDNKENSRAEKRNMTVSRSDNGTALPDNGSGQAASEKPKAHRSFAGSPAQQSLPPLGTILWLESGEIALLDRVSEKHNSQLLLLLNPDGSVQTTAMNLRKTAFEKLGKIPEDDLVSIHIAQSWHREHILFYLNRFEDAPLIPNPEKNHPGPNQPNTPTKSSNWPSDAEEFTPRAELPEETTPDDSEKGNAPYGLKRGQKFTIDFGQDREWSAVYWGGDGTGSLVVHDTHDEWALTRLEFKRFPKESIHVGEMLPEREIWEITEYLKRMYS